MFQSCGGLAGGGTTHAFLDTPEIVGIFRYDVRQAKHATAARGFGDVEESVMSFLATLADVPGDDLKAAFGDPHADDAKRGDDAAQAKATARALVSCGKISPGECLEMLREKASDTFEQDNDHSEEDKKDGESPGQVVLRLRNMHRKALEYRLAHALFESKYLSANTALSFVQLLLSSSMSAVLFLKYLIPYAKPISIVLSTLLTGLNTAIGSLALADKAEQHTAARLAFASTQRSFATTLMVDPPPEITKRFHEYAANWNQTLANTVTIKPVQLQMLRNEDNRKVPLLPLITPPILNAKEMQVVMRAKAAKVKQFSEDKAAAAAEAANHPPVSVEMMNPAVAEHQVHANEAADEEENENQPHENEAAAKAEAAAATHPHASADMAITAEEGSVPADNPTSNTWMEKAAAVAEAANHPPVSVEMIIARSRRSEQDRKWHFFSGGPPWLGNG